MTISVMAPLWMLQAAGALADSAATVSGHVSVAPAGLWRIVSIVQLLASLFVLILLGAVIAVLLRMRQTFDRFDALIGRLGLHADPIGQKVAAIADDLNVVSTKVRTEVDHVTHVVQMAADKLEGAVEGTERRVREIDALVELAQDEAEHAIVSVAATLRGLRGGVSSLRSGLVGRRAGGEAEYVDDEEDDDYGSEHDEPPARPRLRSHRRRRGA
jgi:hypothetical protein